MPTVITVEQESPTNSSSRSNSFTDEGSSTGTGVHVSHTSGSQEDSDLLDDQSWDPVYSDEIEPSESASRPRPTRYRRSDSRQRSVPRGPLRRHTTTERTVNRPPVSRIHRQPAPNPPSSVDPQEEYPGYGRGYLPPSGPYGGRAPQPGYAPSLASFSPNPFGGNAGPVMPYGSPAYPYPQNPFAPTTGVGAQGYFPPHHQTNPHGAPGYGHEIMPYGQSPGYGYPGYGIPPPGPPSQFYAQFVQPQPPSPPSKPASAAPAPPEKSEAERKVEELQKALQDAKLEAERTKQEAERIKRETEEKKLAALIEEEKKRRDAEEKKLAALERLLEDTKHDAERHKKMVEERAAADKKAADEAAANEATDKKVKEAVEKAKAEAEKKTKEAEEEAEKKTKAAEEAKTKAEEEKKAAEEAKKKAEEEAKALSAPKDEKKKPIKFKDAVGRKFSFPFHLCQTWQGMEDLIRQAFLHVDVIGPHVAEGHYDLVGPNGEIILPQVWETMIEPDWAITMHMWPMPEQPKGPPEGVQIVDAAPPGHVRPLSGGRRRADRPGPPPGNRRGPPPPPPPGWIGPPPRGDPGLPPDDIIIIEDSTRSSKKKSKESGMLGGLFGGSSKPSKSGKGRSKKS